MNVGERSALLIGLFFFWIWSAVVMASFDVA
jgi:hypothetical protein